MPQAASDPYARNRGPGRGNQRIVVVMPKDEVAQIDRWGVPAGMDSRNAAIRALLRRGLEAAEKSPAPTVCRTAPSNASDAR